MIQYAINGDPDQTPYNVASDQGLHCLLSEWSIKKLSSLIKLEKYRRTDKGRKVY